MSQIPAGSLHKFLTGENVDGDGSTSGANLNPVFETVRVAINDTDTKVNDRYTKAEVDDKVTIAATGAQPSVVNTPTSVTMAVGLQVISCTKCAALSNLIAQGLTRVNLLGRDGNCEDASKWNVLQATTALDATNKVYGSNGFKVTINTSFTSGVTYKSLPGGLKAGKYYILVAEMKNGNSTSGVSIYLGGSSYATVSVTDTTKFNTVFARMNPVSDIASVDVDLQVVGAAGQYGYFDGVRIYEITQTEYNALPSATAILDSTSQWVANKYPYVDDVKHINAPYVIRYGENLLPPFNEWETGMQTGDSYSLTNPYDLTINASTTSGSFLRYYVPVTVGQAYSLSLSTSGANAAPYMYWCDSAKTRLTSKVTGLNNVAPAGAVLLEVVFNTLNPTTYALQTGTATFTNPRLNLGTTDKGFKARNDDYLFVPNVQLASSVDGTVYDTLYQRDGKLSVLHRFKKDMVLDGSLAWSGTISSFTGYKVVHAPPATTKWVNYSEKLVKYDGKILKTATAGGLWATNGADTSETSIDDNIYISIASADSGWGDAYNPTAAEIQAYFYGWVMTNNFTGIYNGTGTKAWEKRYSGQGTIRDTGFGSLVVNGSGTTTLPTTLNDQGFKPYKLTYQLATPIIEEVAPEGAISTLEGSNQIEVGVGMIVREKANPAASTSYYNINTTLLASSNLLKNRALRILGVYRNGRLDPQWLMSSDGALGPNGTYLTRIPIAQYDPAATYEVTYLALDAYSLTCNPLAVTGEYDPNIKTVQDRLVQRAADVETRVSVLENNKARKVQGQWIAPTLLNAWVNTAGSFEVAGYRINELGEVQLRGLVGSGTVGSIILVLPAGYRPLKTRPFIAESYNGTSEVLARIDVKNDGTVVLNAGGTSWLSLEQIRFTAEQ
jgi:hypothetical protein